MALVMAIGIMTVLAISGTTITYYATSDAGSANRSKAGYSAYDLAEAGINAALSVLSASFQPATGTALPNCPTTSASASVVGGSYTYCGTLTGTTWQITAVGTIRNPAAKGNLSYTLTRGVSILGLNSGSSLAAWSRIYNDDTSTCLTIPNGENIPVNLATRGNLCLTGAEITGSTTNVAVGGTTTITPGSNATAGSNFAGTGTSASWTSPGNVTADDNVSASMTLAGGATGGTLDATNFGFSIPTDATILGISVDVERYAGAANLIKDNSVQLLRAGSPVGSNKAGSTTWPTAGPGNKGTVATYGSAADLWGTTWTAADLNASNFGLRFSAKNSGASSTTANVDEVDITVTYSPQAGIGTATTPVAEADLVGTCKYNGGTAHSPCTSADHVWAGTVQTTASNLQKPTVDFNYWYNNAAPGPKHGCTVSSGTPPVFDNDNTYNDSLGSGPGSFDLAPSGSSYTCISKDANGNVLGQLVWNAATQVLTISGTIFIDGGAEFKTHHFVVHYQGKATIYIADGTHVDAQVCAGGSGATSCVGNMSSWDPTQNMLVLIVGDKSSSSNDDCKIDETDSAFQGVIWAGHKCNVAAGAQVSGPLLANDVGITAGSVINPWPNLGSLLPGQQYGSTSTSTDFLIQPGNQSG